MSEPASVLHKSQKPKTLFDDEPFLDNTIGLHVQSAKELEALFPIVSVDDFKPIKGMLWAQQRWVVADLALQHYEKHAEPLGKMLGGTVLDYAHGLQLNERQVQLLDDYVTHLGKIKLSGTDFTVEKYTKYKLEYRK